MITFYLWCADAEIPELTRLAGTVSRWAEEIFAYHRTANASNGPVENTHMLIEKTRRSGHGFRNPTTYRRRLLGRHTIKSATQYQGIVRPTLKPALLGEPASPVASPAASTTDNNNHRACFHHRCASHRR